VAEVFFEKHYVLSTPNFARRPVPYYAERTILAPVKGVTNVRLGRLPIERIDLRGQRGFASQLRKGSTFSSFYVPIRRTQGDALHLFNQVSFGSKPWGVTFEDSLPRLISLAPNNPVRAFLRTYLLSEHCKFILAISDWARTNFLNTLTIDQQELVKSKLFVLPPYQDLTTAIPQSALADSDTLTLAFVGHDFFRKGGEALLRAVECSGEELNFRVIVIGRIAGNDYATRYLDDVYMNDVRRRLSENPRVSWRTVLPNEEVLRLLSTAHLGVLPTMADSYGYSLLEAMSLGLAVIGTNVQAGIEINADGVGWRLDLPLREDGYWAGLGQDSVRAYDDSIEQLSLGIVTAIRALRDDANILPQYSRNALSRVQRVHYHERDSKMREILAATL
jgi:glycosyltransferase involved in cell wall biosynthesis